MSSQPSIFICYRRGDSEDISGRIYDRLKGRFGAESVFFDIDAIPLGVDFEEYIDASVSQCQIFLAIIGRAWLTITDDEGVPRLESETDFVRLEIESALKREISVIPLLVSLGKMPKKSELPECLQKLASRNGTQVRSGKDFHKDVDYLIEDIEKETSRKSLDFSSASFSESPSMASEPTVAFLASPKSSSTHKSSSFFPLQSRRYFLIFVLFSVGTGSTLLWQGYKDSLESTSGKLQKFSFDVVTVDTKGKRRRRGQGHAKHFLLDLGQGTNLDMIHIPGGSFSMGSPESEVGRELREGPQHRVEIPEFFLGRYPVTQAQWYAVSLLDKVEYELNPDPSSNKGYQLPVERVSWFDVVEFCARVSKLTGQLYRLPSEAEWEYACRAGTKTPYHFGEIITPELANYMDSSDSKRQDRSQTISVGSFPANAFGLCDMHGNVWEWCQDYANDDYEGAPTDGTAWENVKPIPPSRIRRGGAWSVSSRFCRSAFRFPHIPIGRGSDQGFRVACSLM